MELSVLAPGVLTSVVGSAVFALIGMVAAWARDSRSEITGKWRDIIYDESGRVIKEDECKIRHNPQNNALKAKIRRKIPEDQAYRRWKARGAAVDGRIILAFWAKPPIVSSGCIFVTHDGDFQYSGKYARVKGESFEFVDIRMVKVRRKWFGKP